MRAIWLSDDAGDGHGRASVVRAFDALARVYDLAPLQRFGYRPNHDAVLAELERFVPQRVLDVGCGTGILTVRVQSELGPALVIGCDASEGMLSKARARSSSVRWVHGSAEHLPLDDGAVDAVITTEAFHFFDQPVALREFHRVLAPGGRLIVAVITSQLPTMALTRGAPARWPTRGQMRELVREAGFELDRQRAVLPLLGPLSPGVATVAVRP